MSFVLKGRWEKGRKAILYICMKVGRRVAAEAFVGLIVHRSPTD